MIREATESDIPALVSLVEDLVRSIDGPQRVCRLKTGETFTGIIMSGDGVVFMSRRGFIAGCITQTVISPDPIAVELGWFSCDKSGLRLLRAFENWAAERGATMVKMSCAGGAAQSILERSGYRQAEIAMVK